MNEKRRHQRRLEAVKGRRIRNDGRRAWNRIEDNIRRRLAQYMQVASCAHCGETYRIGMEIGRRRCRMHPMGAYASQRAAGTIREALWDESGDQWINMAGRYACCGAPAESFPLGGDARSHVATNRLLRARAPQRMEPGGCHPCDHVLLSLPAPIMSEASTVRPIGNVLRSSGVDCRTSDAGIAALSEVSARQSNALPVGYQTNGVTIPLTPRTCEERDARLAMTRGSERDNMGCGRFVCAEPLFLLLLVAMRRANTPEARLAILRGEEPIEATLDRLFSGSESSRRRRESEKGIRTPMVRYLLFEDFDQLRARGVLLRAGAERMRVSPLRCYQETMNAYGLEDISLSMGPRHWMQEMEHKEEGGGGGGNVGSLYGKRSRSPDRHTLRVAVPMQRSLLSGRLEHARRQSNCWRCASCPGGDACHKHDAGAPATKRKRLMAHDVASPGEDNAAVDEGEGYWEASSSRLLAALLNGERLSATTATATAPISSSSSTTSASTSTASPPSPPSPSSSLPAFLGSEGNIDTGDNPHRPTPVSHRGGGGDDDDVTRVLFGSTASDRPLVARGERGGRDNEPSGGIVDRHRHRANCLEREWEEDDIIDQGDGPSDMESDGMGDAEDTAWNGWQDEMESDVSFTERQRTTEAYGDDRAEGVTLSTWYDAERDGLPRFDDPLPSSTRRKTALGRNRRDRNTRERNDDGRVAGIPTRTTSSSPSPTSPCSPSSSSSSFPLSPSADHSSESDASTFESTDSIDAIVDGLMTTGETRQTEKHQHSSMFHSIVPGGFHDRKDEQLQYGCRAISDASEEERLSIVLAEILLARISNPGLTFYPFVLWTCSDAWVSFS